MSMSTRTGWLALIAALCVGCGEAHETETGAGAPPATNPAATEGPGAEAPPLTTPAPGAPGPDATSAPGSAAAAPAAEVTLSPQEVANINTLPEADRAAALKQKVCPISGAHLGDENMGAPVKVTAGGKTAFLCCEGCEEDFTKDPAAALAKLGLDK